MPVAGAGAGKAGAAGKAQRLKNVPPAEKGVGKTADMEGSTGTGTRSIEVSRVLARF